MASSALPPLPDSMQTAQQAGVPSAGGGFSPSMMPQVMNAMQMIQQGGQTLAQTLPQLAGFVADFLSQLQQAVPNVVMSASGQPAPQAAPPMGGVNPTAPPPGS